MRRFAKRHNLVYRQRSQLVSKDPNKLATDYMDYIRPTLTMLNTHQNFIINMDETTVPFNMSAESTLEKKGAKTVTIRSTGLEKNGHQLVLPLRHQERCYHLL